VEKQIQIELGKPFWFASKTLLPMAWRATGAESPFPSLEADLEVPPGRQSDPALRERPLPTTLSPLPV